MCLAKMFCFIVLLFSLPLYGAAEEESGCNCKNSEGTHPLFFAISIDDMDLFQTLLADGADTDVRDPEGNTLLLYALLKGRLDFVPFLLSCVDINAQNQRGETPLQIAAMQRDETLIEILELAGAHNAAIEFFENDSPFFQAIEEGRFRDLRNFLHHGVDPNERDRNGIPAIQRALNHPNIFRLLYIEGADPYVTNSEGETLLHQSVNISLEVLEFLLQQGWNPNLRFGEEESPVHIAARTGALEAYILLLSYGGNPFLTNYGTSAVEWAVIKQHIDIVSYTLYRFMRISSIGHDFILPLYTRLAREACRIGNLYMLILFLDYGANLNELDSKGRSFLYQASLYDHNHILLFLLEWAGGLHRVREDAETIETLENFSIDYFFQEGEDPEREPLLARRVIPISHINTPEHEYGETPIARAVVNSYIEGARILLEFGADVFQNYPARMFVGGRGNSAYEEARVRGRRDPGIRRLFSAIEDQRTNRYLSHNNSRSSGSSSSSHSNYLIGLESRRSERESYSMLGFGFGALVLSFNSLRNSAPK